jgi:DNA-binding XRE family transcriptional regulator
MHPRDRHLFASIRREFTDAAGNPLRAAGKSGEHMAHVESESRATESLISPEALRQRAQARAERYPGPGPRKTNPARELGKQRAAERLQRARKAAGWGRLKFAKALGVDKRTVIDWELSPAGHPIPPWVPELMRTNAPEVHAQWILSHVEDPDEKPLRYTGTS